METLSSYTSEIIKFQKLINDNYGNASGFLALLKESVSSSVEATLNGMNPAPTVTETIELDAAWWEAKAEQLGWIKDGNSYYYVDPETGYKYYYNPKGHKMRVVDSKGKSVEDLESFSCHIYLNGNLSDVEKSSTLIKCMGRNGETYMCDHSANAQLVILPDADGGNGKLTSKRVFYSTKLGEMLLGSAGNTDYTREMVGFSNGGVQSLYIASGRYDDKHVGYFQEITLVNISPDINFEYSETQKQNLSNMTINVVQNYNNIINTDNRTVNGVLAYCDSTEGGPHLDKLASIPGSKINLILPDISKDGPGFVTKLVAYADGLNLDNVSVVQYNVSDDDLKAYGIGVNSSHGSGRDVLVPAYLSGDLEPIN